MEHLLCVIHSTYNCLFRIHKDYQVDQFNSDQSCLTLWDLMDCSTPGLPVHHQFLEFTQTHVHWVSWCHPTSSSSVVPFSSHLQSFPASGSFLKSQFLHQVAKVLEVQLQHKSFQLISRVDFLWDWLVGCPCSQGNLKSFLQHHSSKRSILRCSAFFIVQLSHP